MPSLVGGWRREIRAAASAAIAGGPNRSRTWRRVDSQGTRSRVARVAWSARATPKNSAVVARTSPARKRRAQPRAISNAATIATACTAVHREPGARAATASGAKQAAKRGATLERAARQSPRSAAVQGGAKAAISNGASAIAPAAKKRNAATATGTSRSAASQGCPNAVTGLHGAIDPSRAGI